MPSACSLVVCTLVVLGPVFFISLIAYTCLYFLSALVIKTSWFTPLPCHSLSSDHYIISFQLLLSKSVSSREKPRYVFDFPKANLTGLCDFLLDIDFSSCLASNNTEYVWSAIKQAIYTGMDLFIPKVRIRSYQYPVWFTPELRHLSKCI